MNRVTEKELEAIVGRINRMTGSPDTAYTRQPEGRMKANIGNYHLSYAYGGVQLVRMTNEGGGVSNVLGTGHVPKRELAGLMYAFINGLDAKA